MSHLGHQEGQLFPDKDTAVPHKLSGSTPRGKKYRKPLHVRKRHEIRKGAGLHQYFLSMASTYSDPANLNCTFLNKQTFSLSIHKPYGAASICIGLAVQTQRWLSTWKDVCGIYSNIVSSPDRSWRDPCRDSGGILDPINHC